MATTDNFNWTLHDSGSDGWDGELNGILTDIDTELAREIATFDNEVQVFDGFVQKVRVKN